MKKNSSFFKVLIGLFLSVCLLGVSSLTFAGELQRKLVQESAIEKIMRKGEMKIGIGIFVPWSFKDINGKLTGFEVDVAKKVAKDMGVKAKFVPTEWSGIIPSLLTGKFDVIIGGMGITAERALKVNFSNPYSYTGMDIVASKKMLPGATSIADLNKSHIILAVRMGATPVSAAKKYLPKAKLHQFEDDAAVIQDVLNGNAHAALSSSPKPAFWAADYANAIYRPLDGKYLYDDPSSFAMRKGDADTMFFYNAWIADNQAFLEEKAAYWFGSKKWAHLVAK
jgi:polar amino acid transport system substrate-binding protein